jgi:translation elongation factor EF-Ts
VKDDKVTVGELANGAKMKIKRFVAWKLTPAESEE